MYFLQIPAVLSCFSCVWLFATPWTVACQAPLFIELSRQEYWSGLPFPPPGDLLDPGIKPASLLSPALADRFFTTSATWEARFQISAVSFTHDSAQKSPSQRDPCWLPHLTEQQIRTPIFSFSFSQIYFAQLIYYKFICFLYMFPC